VAHIRPYDALPTLSIKNPLPTIAWVLLIAALVLSGTFQKAFAQKRQTTPAVSGVPDATVLAFDIPLISDGCCGRLDVRAQFLLKSGQLVWAEGSDTPIRKMPANGGAITTIARWTGSPLNAVVRGPYIYWIEFRDHPNTGQPLPRLNRSSLDGANTVLLDEGPWYLIFRGTADILVTDTDAYWVNAVDTTVCNEASCTSGHIRWTIRKVPLNGGAPTTLVTTDVSSEIVSLATDGTHLYWQENGVYMGSSRVKKKPLAGGEAIDLVDGSLNGGAEDWEPVGGIAVDGAELFFASNTYPNGYRLMKVPVSGGAVTTLTAISGSYEAAPRKLGADDANVYWADAAKINSTPRSGGSITVLAGGLGLPSDIVINNGHVFWAEDYCCGGGVFTGNIKMMPVTGGAPTTLVNELNGVRSLDVASGSLYFIEGDPYPPPGGASGRIAKAPIAGGPVTTLVTAVMADAGTPMTVDDNNVYFADASGLKKVSLQGGVVERLASELVTDTIYALAADGQFVYFLSGRRSPIVRKIPVGGGPIEDVTVPVNTLRHSSARLVLSDGYFYWVERSYSVPPADAIMKASVQGGPATALVSGLSSLGDIAVSGGNVFFVESGYPNTLRRISIDGGPISALAGVHGGTTLATDGAGVYWVNDFYLSTVAVGGGNERWLAYYPGGIGLALDPGGIYWLDYEGHILKIDRSTIDGYVNMVTPGPGEVWQIRTRRLIQWWYAGIGSRINISLSRDGGFTWTRLFRNKPNNGSIFWKVSKPAAAQAIIRVCSVAVPTLCDTSGTFTIQ
jgi:hypothetical protein